MPHASTPLIATIVIGLSLAFVLGTAAARLRLSPLVGYLLAGVVVGPFTPGYVADGALASELAELGVILLMFGVGLHFSFKDLLSVRAIAVPGAIAQIVAATLMGMGLGVLLGWPLYSGLVLGLALSVASTVVLLRALEERRLVDTERGRIAVGWLIVEDLAMVLVLVLLPPVGELLAPGLNGAAGLAAGDVVIALGLTLAKVVAFVVLMMLVGRRVIPWILQYTVRYGSRELFRLSVLVVALGVAFGAAQLFGVSFALGAFFAGMVLNESELAHEAAEESLPLRDAFAVLFFVSVGMLFNPLIVVTEPLAVAGVLFIILIGKSAVAFLIALAFRHPLTTAFTIAASLAQIGEFSFILAGLGVSLGLLPETGRDLVLAGAILSIVLNPLIFNFNDWLLARFGSHAEPKAPVAQPIAAALHRSELTGHAVVVGYGRVGSLVVESLRQLNQPFVVIEFADRRVQHLRREGLEAIIGNGATPELLEAGNIGRASRLFVAIPDALEAGQIIGFARSLNPALEIIARAHSQADLEHLSAKGANTVIMGEHEIARSMIKHAYAFG
jgi:monovalent cation:H+ antiporter-2, CPA2 family